MLLNMAVETLFHRVPCYIRKLLGQMEEIWHYAVLCGGRSLVFVNVSTWGAVVTAVVRHLMRLEAKEREADPGNIQPSIHLVPKPWLMLLAFQAELNLILEGRCRTDTGCSSSKGLWALPWKDRMSPLAWLPKMWNFYCGYLKYIKN